MSIDILAVLQSHPCVSSVESLSTEEITGGSGQSFRFHAHKNGHEWKLIIHINNTFPFDLPKISIENAADYQAMGHIDWHGDVCYIDKQGLVIDYNRNQDVIYNCINEALETLNENFNDPHKVELHNDFKSYWESVPSLGFKTTCFVSYDGNVKELIAYRDIKNERKSKKTTCLAVVEDNHGIVNFYYLLNKLKGKKSEKSIYIPLDKPVTPPSPKQIWTSADIAKVFEESATTAVKEIALELVKKQKWSNYFTIIFSHPRSDSGHVFWGVQFHRKDTAPNPLVDPKLDWDVSPLLLSLHNKEHLLERSANTANLDKKRVGIVGCGSVGSGIAIQLAKAGIGELHLIDFDKMEVENIYRHTLGATALNNESDGLYKTDALSFQIVADIPYTKVVNFNDHLLSFTVQKGFFDYFDAIVVTTGDFTCELVFNRLHKALNNISKIVPVIYAWQDGFGIGGHSICVSNNKVSGCLECLYTNEHGFEPHPKTSFIKYGQTISKHLGGCSGAFTPYTFLDASQTALLASRMTLDALQGKVVNEIRSWKGSDEQLKAEGHSPSIWYQKSPEYFIKDNSNYISSKCSVCGKYHQI